MAQRLNPDPAAPAELKEALDALSSLRASRKQAEIAILWVTASTRGRGAWSMKPPRGSEGEGWATLAFLAQADADELIGSFEIEWGPMSEREYAAYVKRQSPEQNANLCAEIPLEPILDWFGECPPDQAVRRANVISMLDHFIRSFALPRLPSPEGRVREPLRAFVKRLATRLPKPSLEAQAMLREAFLPLIEAELLKTEASTGSAALRRSRI